MPANRSHHPSPDITAGERRGSSSALRSGPRGANAGGSRRWASGRDRAIEGALAFRAVLGSLESTGGDPFAVAVSLSPGG
jgi:hypothetical protein